MREKAAILAPLFGSGLHEIRTYLFPARVNGPISNREINFNSKILRLEEWSKGATIPDYYLRSDKSSSARISLDSGSMAFYSKSKSLKGVFTSCLLGAMFALASERIFEHFGINPEADTWHATDAVGGPEDEYPELEQGEMRRYLKKANLDISTVQQRLKPYEHNHIARKVRGSISSKTIQELAKETELPEEVIERMIESLIDYGILYPASRKILTPPRVQRKGTPARGTK